MPAKIAALEVQPHSPELELTCDKRLNARNPMNRLRDLLVDGVLLALPLGAAAYLLHQVVGLLARLLTPLSHLLPEGHWYGVAVLDIVAVMVLLLVLIALGAFARSRPGKRLAASIEQFVLSKIPGYLIIKSTVAKWSSTGDEAGLRPALVSFDDNTVLGFIVEESDLADSLTVFIPGAPSATSGSVVLVPRARVRVLDVPLGSAKKSMKQLGMGLQHMTNIQSRA